MNQEVQDSYRAAFEFASSELREILEKFERLSARKDQLERLITVLKMIIGSEKVVESETQADEGRESGLTIVDSSPVSSEEPEGLMADPFQRRIDHVLGIGAGIRDVRRFTRQF